MTYKWTFMVYMAGDNGKIFKDGMQLMDDLTDFGWNDIKEMSSVGSTSDVAIVVQYDTLDATETPRLFIDGANETGTPIEKVPPVNTGDPKNLTDFIVWGMENYPAKQYALVLWNHGTGWKEDDIYAQYRTAKEIVQRDQIRAASSRRMLLGRALFMSTAGQIMSIEDDDTRAICYDDSSMDFLDNQKLVKAFLDAEAQTGQRITVLGMDACLMSMIEVAYQVREHADYLVGSQEVERAEGWPYREILNALANEPEMSAVDLSGLIVDEFGKYYTSASRSGGGNNTQSAIDLRATGQTFERIQALAALIAKVYASDLKTEVAVTRAKHSAQSFKDKDFVDLRHLMELLRDEYDGNLAVADLANDLVKNLTAERPGSPVAKNFHGHGRPQANGLSIYFPPKSYSPFYSKQAFAASGWHQVIRLANRL